MRYTVQIVLVLLLATIGLSGCSRDAGTISVAVSPGAAAQATLPGIATLSVPEGALEGGSGAVSLTQWSGDLPSHEDFPDVQAWDTAVDVDLQGATAVGDLDLAVDAEGPPSPDAVPIFAHRRDDGSWELREAWSADGSTVTLRSSDFSVNVLGWLTDKASKAARAAVAIIRGPLDSLADSLVGRTDPDVCPDDAPAWASVRKATTLVHVCLASAADGSSELRLKSNRRFFTTVAVPPEFEGIAVEGSDSWLISHALPLLSKGRAANDILLPDQTRLTVQVDPTEDEAERRITVFTDHWTAAISLSVGVIATLGGEAVGAKAAGVLAAVDCAQNIPKSLTRGDWWSFYTCIVQASVSELSDPKASVRAARLIVADVPETEVAASTEALQTVAPILQKIGAVVKVVGLAFLVRDIFKQIPDAFSQMGDDRTGDVVVTTQAAPETPDAGRWQRYVNGRFQFGVDVPPGFTQDQPGPANGDGDSFTDGTARLSAYGANIGLLEETPASAFDEAVRSGNQEGTVTYKALLDDGFAVSGLDEQGRVYYRREWIGEQSMNALWWTYPADETGYAAMVERSVRSFSPGDLSESH